MGALIASLASLRWVPSLLPYLIMIMYAFKNIAKVLVVENVVIQQFLILLMISFLSACGGASTNGSDSQDDRTAPLLPTIETLLIDSTTPTLTGSADSDTTLSITVGGAIYINVPVNDDGGWSLDLASAVADSGALSLSDGIYNVGVISTDAAGNSTADTTRDELSIDSTAPGAPAINTLLTNTTTPILTGSADSDATLSITVDGATYSNVSVNDDGNWSLDLASAVADSGTLLLYNGVYNVAVVATDGAGNSTADATSDELTIDTEVDTDTLPAFAGKLTYYGGNPDGGACGFDLPVHYVDSSYVDYYAAAGANIFKDGKNCGMVVEISNPARFDTDNADCITNENTIVRVMIADSCPGCDSNHLDLSPIPFAGLVGPGLSNTCGTLTADMRFVAGNLSGTIGIQNKEQATAYWYGVRIYGHNLPIASVAFKSSGSSTWIPAIKSDGPSFYKLEGSGYTLIAPLSVKLTDVNGGVITAIDVITYFTADMVFDTGIQFSGGLTEDPLL
jgi:hypothetical protein